MLLSESFFITIYIKKKTIGISFVFSTQWLCKFRAVLSSRHWQECRTQNHLLHLYLNIALWFFLQNARNFQDFDCQVRFPLCFYTNIFAHGWALTEMSCKTKLWWSVCLFEAKSAILILNTISVWRENIKSRLQLWTYFFFRLFKRHCRRVAETFSCLSSDFILSLWSANNKTLSSEQTGDCPWDVLLPALRLWRLLPLRVQPSIAALQSPLPCN